MLLFDADDRACRGVRRAMRMRYVIAFTAERFELGVIGPVLTPGGAEVKLPLGSEHGRPWRG